MTMKTEIIIVNYRTKDLTLDCLASLAQHTLGESAIHVTLVDNDSKDGSVEFLRQAVVDHQWHSWIDVIALDRNGGFAYGNNAAIERTLHLESPPDFYWLLNPDTLVRADALRALQDYLETNVDVGIVGSRLEDPDGTPQRSMFRFPTLPSELDAGLQLGLVSRLLSRFVIAPAIVDQACRIDWVAGASMLVRREVFEQVGLLDEEYFMYYEEVDFCRKAGLADFPCAYEPKSRVVHLVGQASGVTNREMTVKRRPKYWFDSRRRYFLKNHGAAYAFAVDSVWILAYSLWRLRCWVQRRKTQEPTAFLSDFIRNSVFFKGIAT